MTNPDVLLVFCRSVIFGAVLMLWGATAFRWRLFPKSPRLRFEACATITLVAGIVVLLPVQVARITGDWTNAFDTAAIQDVIGFTRAGTAWALQAIAALGLVGAFALSNEGATLVFASVILIAQSMTGHAAASDGLCGLLRQANDALHLMAAGAWLGALPYVLMLLPRLGTPETNGVLVRYSGEGHFWVSIVLVTGLIATFSIFGGLPLDWSVRYQLLLSVKVVITIIMIGLAIRNRYWLVPRLAEGRQPLKAIARATWAEIALGLAAVALVAWFGTLDPR